MSVMGSKCAAVLIIMGLAFFTGCTVSVDGGGNGDGGGPPGNVDGNGSNGGDGQGNGGGTDEFAAGRAAFAENGCTACHTAQSNNFENSSLDDVVDALLGVTPHPADDFSDLTDQELDDIAFFLAAVVSGETTLEGGGGGGGGETSTHAAFGQVWGDFDRNYSHFQTKGVDWDAIRTQYEPRFPASLSDEELLAVMAEMLAELRDLHVWLFDAGGESVEVYSKPAAQNYPSGYPQTYFPNGVQQMQQYPLRHALMEGNIAYISIETFDGDQWDGLSTGQVDDLFAQYADAQAMVIDIRSNNGGNELVGAAFAGHLTDSAYVYGYHRTKNTGTDHADFGDFVEHRLEPAENEPFLRRVACLIGETNLSSAEWFVLMMLENPRGITLIGDTTRGSSGNPQEFRLDNGIAYYIPSWEAYRADQTTPIEDVGVPPTAGYALPPEESYTDDRDFVLERALELLTQ